MGMREEYNEKKRYLEAGRLYREGAYTEADTLLNGLLETHPHNTILLLAKARVLIALNRYDEAQTILAPLAAKGNEKAKRPNKKNILYPMALCLEKMGRHDEARRVCHDLIRLDQDPRAVTMLERIDAGSQNLAITHEELPPRPVGVVKKLAMTTVVFALVGTIAGLAMAMASMAFARELYLEVTNWRAMQSWDEVPARIQEMNFSERRITGSDPDEDRIEYVLTARYTYEYQEHTIEGNRVFQFRDSEGIEAYVKKAAHELEKYHESGQPFRCYVNPNRPNQSVLYRDLPPGAVSFSGFGILVFGLAAFAFPWMFIRMARKEWTRAALQAKYPGQPWRWTKSWQTGRIKCSNKNKAIGSIIVSFLVNAFVILALLGFPNIVSEGEHLPIVYWIGSGLLVLLAAAATLAAYRNAVRWRKFGEATFELTTMPGVIGGLLCGYMHLPPNVRPQEGFALQLHCAKRETRKNSSNETKVSTQTLWRKEQRVPNTQVQAGRNQVIVPVRFEIPEDLPESGALSSSVQISWHVNIRAAVPGIDYQATFCVPIYART